MKLEARLTSAFGIAACVGGIVGLGIMRAPGEIAAAIQQPLPYMGLWLLVGLFVLMSTAIVVELVAMTPRSGGVYVLVRRAYGPYPGFLIGWVDWLSFGATFALKAVVVIEFAALLMPELAKWTTAGGVVITTLFAAIQLAGVNTGARLQQVAATLIGLAMIGFTLALFLAGLQNPGSERLSQSSQTPELTVYGLIVASVVFAYDGWLYASYFGGEIKGGGGAVAKACIRGVLIVLVIYLAINGALVLAVPLRDLIGHDLALAGALDLAVFDGAGTIVIFTAIITLLLQQNLGYMAGARVLHALSEDGLGTQRATGVSAAGTPTGAVILTWLLTAGLILVGGFNFLLNLTVLLYIVLYLALLIGVFVVRKTDPGAPRPFLAFGHPYTTVVGITGWMAVIFFVGYGSPESAGYAAALIAVSSPAWLALRHIRNPTT